MRASQTSGAGPGASAWRLARWSGAGALLELEGEGEGSWEGLSAEGMAEQCVARRSVAQKSFKLLPVLRHVWHGRHAARGWRKGRGAGWPRAGRGRGLQRRVSLAASSRPSLPGRASRGRGRRGPRAKVFRRARKKGARFPCVFLRPRASSGEKVTLPAIAAPPPPLPRHLDPAQSRRGARSEKRTGTAGRDGATKSSSRACRAVPPCRRASAGRSHSHGVARS